MPAVNKAILLGHVGCTPTLNYTHGENIPVTTISLATTERFKIEKGGSRRERTTWHKVVFWRGLAEIVCEYVSKGSLIYVEGRLQTRSYDKNGEPVYVTEVVAQIMQICSKRNDPPANNLGELDPAELGEPMVIED